MPAMWPYILNLSNGIIGVGMLAMPFCFKECGILLGALLLLMTNYLNRLSSHMLITAAHILRRRSYEHLALEQLGQAGKLIVEVMTILYIISMLIVFFVIMGDTGLNVASRWFVFSGDIHSVRFLIMALTAIIVLPISLIRNIDNLVHFSSLAILCYAMFVVWLVCAAVPVVLEGNWMSEINWWRPAGVLESLPIFALSLSCQTSLFVLYNALPEQRPVIMNEISTKALNLCSALYLSVGLFGYLAFYHTSIPGDILMLIDNSITTHLLKLFFLFSVAVSFPLMVFPCRASIYSFLCTHRAVAFDQTLEVMPDGAFMLITVCLIVMNFALAIIMPNVEVVLSLSGSLIGSVICFVLPAWLYLTVCDRFTNNTSSRIHSQLSDNGGLHLLNDMVPISKLAAQITFAFGLFTLFVCTLGTLTATPSIVPIPAVAPASKIPSADAIRLPPAPGMQSVLNISAAVPPQDLLPVQPAVFSDQDKGEQRHEPPLPFEPPPDSNKQVAQEVISEETVKAINSKAAEVNDKAIENPNGGNIVGTVLSLSLLDRLGDKQSQQRQLLEQQKKAVVDGDLQKREVPAGIRPEVGDRQKRADNQAVVDKNTLLKPDIGSNGQKRADVNAIVDKQLLQMSTEVPPRVAIKA